MLPRTGWSAFITWYCLKVKNLGGAVGSVEPARQLAELPGLVHGLGVWGQQEDERRLVVGGVQRREGRPQGPGGAWGRTPGAFKGIRKIGLKMHQLVENKKLVSFWGNMNISIVR